MIQDKEYIYTKPENNPTRHKVNSVVTPIRPSIPPLITDKSSSDREAIGPFVEGEEVPAGYWLSFFFPLQMIER